MLDTIRTEIVTLEQLRGFTGIEKELRSDLVMRMAKSIKLVGVIHLPRVHEDGRIVVGKVCILAQIAGGRTKFEVEIVTGSDEDIAMEQEESNLIRRHYTARKWTGYYNKLLTKRKSYKQRLRNLNPLPRPSRKAKPDPVVPAEQTAPIDMMGLAVNDKREWYKELRGIQERMGVIQHAMNRGYSGALGLQNSIPTQAYRVICSAIERVNEVVQEAMPVSICLHCKGLAGLCSRCLVCAGNGYATSAQVRQAPAELTDRDILAVAYHGNDGLEFVSYIERLQAECLHESVAVTDERKRCRNCGKVWRL